MLSSSRARQSRFAIPNKNMKNETNESTPATIAIPTRDAVRSAAKNVATLAGCDEKKSIATEDYQAILMLMLVRFKLMPIASLAAARSVFKNYDANASALRQRLYESKESETKIDKEADKWMELAAAEVAE